MRSTGCRCFGRRAVNAAPVPALSWTPQPSRAKTRQRLGGSSPGGPCSGTPRPLPRGPGTGCRTARGPSSCPSQWRGSACSSRAAESLSPARTERKGGACHCTGGCGQRRAVTEGHGAAVHAAAAAAGLFATGRCPLQDYCGNASRCRPPTRTRK